MSVRPPAERQGHRGGDAEVFGGLIHQTSDLLAGYTDDQLLVIDDFLTRIRQLTAAYADALGGPT